MSDRNFISRQEEPMNKDNERVHVEGRTDRIAGPIHEHLCKTRDDA